MESINHSDHHNGEEQQQQQYDYHEEFDKPYPRQGDAETQYVEQQQPQVQQQKQQQQRSGILDWLDFSVIRKPPTIMMLINIGLLLLTSFIVTGWRGSTRHWISIVDGYSFFVATLMIPFFILIFFVVILLFQFDRHLSNVNFPFAFLINCVLWAFFLVISSSVVLGYSSKYRCDEWKCSHLMAVGAFGFLCVVGLLIEAFLHFMEIRNGRR